MEDAKKEEEDRKRAKELEKERKLMVGFLSFCGNSKLHLLPKLLIKEIQSFSSKFSLEIHPSSKMKG